jgi:hypothetical protein
MKKHIWASGGIAPPFMTAALDGDEWLASRPGRGTDWIRGWMDPTAGLDAVKKRKIFVLSEIEPRPCSPSLYRLSYPGQLHRGQCYVRLLDLEVRLGPSHWIDIKGGLQALTAITDVKNTNNVYWKTYCVGTSGVV